MGARGGVRREKVVKVLKKKVVRKANMVVLFGLDSSFKKEKGEREKRWENEEKE